MNAVWEKTIVQTCIVHLLRNSFKYASKRDWAQIAKDLKPVYTAASESEALDRFAEFSGKWEKRYPAIIRLWENAWAEFVPFLRFDREIRTVICTTNAIESINARLRRAVNARGHFPTEQAALKCLYLAIMSLDPTGKGRQAVDQPVEGRPQRLRHHLRRPPCPPLPWTVTTLGSLGTGGTPMVTKYQKFADGYKAEAVKLYRESNQTIAETARNLGLKESTLANWVKKDKDNEAVAAGEAPLTPAERTRIRDLEADVRRLNMENAFLKKASAYFASQNL